MGFRCWNDGWRRRIWAVVPASPSIWTFSWDPQAQENLESLQPSSCLRKMVKNTGEDHLRRFWNVDLLFLTSCNIIYAMHPKRTVGREKKTITCRYLIALALVPKNEGLKDIQGKWYMYSTKRFTYLQPSHKMWGSWLLHVRRLSKMLYL